MIYRGRRNRSGNNDDMVAPHGRRFTKTPLARTLLAATAVGVGLVGGVLPAVTAGAAAEVKTAAAGCPTAQGASLSHPVGISSTNIGGCGGYLVANSTGKVAAFGAAGTYGDMAGHALNAPIIGITATPGGHGYYLLAADGGIFSFGDARFFGSTGGQRLTRPVVSMAVTPDGGGYWLVAADGGIFSFGDARFHGSTGALHLTRPVVGMAATPDGGGYWLVAADGGIFAFGDAQFYGSMGGTRLNRPIAGMTASPDGHGYRLVAADGGVFDFGDAQFYGSLGANPPPAPVVGLAVTPDGGGYYALDAQGNIYPFGTAPTFGSAACAPNDPGRYGVDPNMMANDGGGTQLTTIADPNPSALAGTFTAWTRTTAGCWVPAALAGQPAQPYRVETGYGGIIPGGNRLGGSGATPQGVFPFGAMYGVSNTVPNPAYPYHHLVCGDWWDEAPGSPTYDSFQHYPCGTTPPFAYSAERLWTETQAYVHFVDILTPNPPQNSAGIFLHDDTSSGYTAGCVALPPAELDAVLGWLSPAAQPHIIIGTNATMNSL